jgi:hypothetical protein
MSHTYRYALRFGRLFIFVLLIGQNLAIAQTERGPRKNDDLRSTPAVGAVEADQLLVSRVISALQKLRADVIVHRSLDHFERDGRLAHVPFETFARRLNEVATEITPLLSKMSDSKLRTSLINTLESYRDGAFWWSKLDQPKVVKVTNLQNSFTTTAPAEHFFESTIPYTVAIHWKLADKYLVKAEKLAATPSLRATRDLSSLRISRNQPDERD